MVGLLGKVASPFRPTTQKRSGDYPSTMRQREVGAEPAILVLGRRNLSHNSLFWPFLSVSLEELALPRLIRYELSWLRCHGHSLLLFSYLCRIKWKENFSCSACGHPLHKGVEFPGVVGVQRKNRTKNSTIKPLPLPASMPLQDLIHLLLDCTASEPLRRAIFGTLLLPF